MNKLAQKGPRPVGAEPTVRMVARGDMEKTPDHVYAPVANIVELCTFVLLNLDFDNPFRHLDVNSAFLYGRFAEPIFIKLPAGHPQNDGRRLMWKTNCAIYGLAQSPKISYGTINEFLRG